MNIFGVSYHSVMCDMRYIHNGIHMRCEIHFAFEDRNMAPVPQFPTMKIFPLILNLSPLWGWTFRLISLKTEENVSK